MINKYNNPRLFNTVLTGPGMTHPRNPHVVIGSDNKGFVQGDLMDANAIMETIDQKIDVDNLIDEEKLTTAVQTAVDSILGDVSESLDTLKEVEDKFEEVEDSIPTKLSQLQNVAVAAPEIGDYLYNDFTWGKDSTDAIGICVGTPDMFPDGKARFCELQVSRTRYKWSTERVDTSLPNISNVVNDTFSGWTNTDVLINLGNNKYPAASYARTKFGNKGYLPTAGELDKCKTNIRNFVKYTDQEGVSLDPWSSTEYTANQVYTLGLLPIPGVVYTDKTYLRGVLAFYTIDIPKYVTTTDLATSEKAGLMSPEQQGIVSDMYHDRDELVIGTNTKVDGSLVVQDGMTLYGSGMTVEGDTDTVTLTGEDFVQLKQLISNG